MTTDLLVALILLYFFVRGWTQGFFRTLLGPAALIVSCILGYLYFRKTQNLAIGLTVCLIGPFLITFIVAGGQKLWYKAVSDKPQPIPPVPSRFMGAAVNILWGGSYLVMTLFLIGILPIKANWYKSAQADVLQSKTYGWITGFTDNKLPATPYDVSKIQELLQDPEQIGQYESTPEFQALANDEQLKALLKDEEIVQLIMDKNYTALMTNPKIQALAQDPDLIMKMFALNSKIMEGNTGGAANNKPKIIDVK